MKQLAYLGVYELGDGAYAGGLLICDQRGLPVDFRYVEPIRPTKLQKLIYGAALRRYIVVEAIGAGLLKECEANYAAAFVDDNLLFELADRCKAPLVMLRQSSGEPLKDAGAWQKMDGNGVAFQARDNNPPIHLQFANGGDTAPLEDFMKDLATLSETLDIMEPMERVKKAVAEVGKINSEDK